MTGVRLLIVASLVIVLAAWAAISPVAQSRGQPHIATIRTLPAGPASLSAAVWPAFAVDGRGTAYFFDGTCGAKPANCWCDVMRQRAGERHPTVIAGHVPGSDLSAATPAQRLTLAGCNSIAVE